MPVRGPANLGPNFYPKLVKISNELGVKPEDLLAVMTSESGLNPSAYESKYKASGLMAFMPDTLKGLGFHGTWKDFTLLSGEDQLDYVKKLVKNNMNLIGNKPFNSAGEYYVANLWPLGLKLPGVQKGDPNTKILESNPERDPSGKYSKKYFDLGHKISADFESKAYAANPLFDKDPINPNHKKGYITYGDLIKQTQINKKNPIYQKAILDMKNITGHEGSTLPLNMPSKNTSTLENTLNQYVNLVSAASGRSTKKIYQKYLTNNDILITVSSDEYTNSIEFSRILCTALDEKLLSTSYTHTDGQDVEIECNIAGPTKECFNAIKQMVEVFSEAFTTATIKIGGIKVTTNCIMNKKSSYQPLSLKTADTNFRKFLLKFI